MPALHRILPALLVALPLGCATPADPEPTYHRDIKPLVDARCGFCHDGSGIGPFELTSYEHLLSYRHAVRGAVESRRMPPYLAGAGCAEYSDDPRLTEEEIALVSRWTSGEAKEGTPEPARQPLAPQNLVRADLTLKMPVEYQPIQSPDDYRCFLIDWPLQTQQYVTGFVAEPGNARIVHHVIAFLIPPSRAAEYETLDAAEPGPGYTCFGGPGGSGRGAQWLGAWAPGGSGRMYPEGTGLPVAPGSKVALQVHYNVNAGTAADLTSVKLALAETVRRKAVILPFTNYQWVQGKGMNIPAHQAEVSHSFAFDPIPYMGLISSGALGSGNAFAIHSVSFHQHLLGSGGRIEIVRQGGERECLLDIPRWDFHWQLSYALAKPRVLRSGDQLSISCRWNNSAEGQPVVNGARQTPRDVKWGEGTTDEMCLGILYASE